MDIEKLAREAGLGRAVDEWRSDGVDGVLHDELCSFAEAVRRETAEEAAQLCEASRARVRDGTDVDWQDGYNAACDENAYAIRKHFKAS